MFNRLPFRYILYNYSTFEGGFPFLVFMSVFLILMSFISFSGGDTSLFVTYFVGISGCAGLLVSSYEYYTSLQKSKEINSINQPHPHNVIDNFLNWEKGDIVKTKFLRLEYQGVTDERGLVFKRNNERYIYSYWKEFVNGEKKSYRPDKIILPPSYFSIAGFKNESLQKRLKKEHNEELESMTNSDYQNLLNEVRKEIKQLD